MTQLTKILSLLILVLLLIAGYTAYSHSKIPTSQVPLIPVTETKQEVIQPSTTTKNKTPTILKKGGISGVVLLGPTCPVMRNPPDPGCADKPYKTNLVVTTKDGTRIITELSSDENGRFSVELIPGEYVIQGKPSASILPRCTSSEAEKVVSNIFTNVTISCDTGIR